MEECQALRVETTVKPRENLKAKVRRRMQGSIFSVNDRKRF
jgi:hypothetical protein